MNALAQPRSEADLFGRIAQLERQVEKLTRIKRALVDRVERSMDGQGSAFSLFQTAIVLEAQIRARTLALEQTLADLERSYNESAKAREQAETARLQLFAAIESVSEGFVLFDAQDRLTLFNQRYLTFWPGMADQIHAGMSFSEMVHLAVQHKGVLDAYRDPEGWIRRRLRQHAECVGPTVHALSDGRWMQINEKRTGDGGIVGIYTDITNLKRRETLQWEAALAKKSNLLQATLDSIYQGVAVYDTHLALVAWNNEFVRLLELTPRCIRRGAGFADLRRFNAALGAGGITNPEFLDPHNGRVPLKFEQPWHNGRILDIERSPMPDGGFVLTFTDISQRKRNEEALRDGERRIRLVTDAMPALIAYVDAEERYQFVNEPYRQWVGRDDSDILGRPMQAVLAPEFYARCSEFAGRALQGEGVAFELELTPGESGVRRYAHVTFLPHIGDGEAILGFFTLMQDVTERRRADAAIKEANETLEKRVDERTIELRRLNAKLEQEISERREIEKALQIAKSQAEQANLSKTRFLAAASHDLLQPLNSARLFVSALAELPHAKQIRTLVDNVDVSLSAVEDLLGALLDISKLDAGAVSPEIVDFPIGSLLGPLTTEHMVLARDRGLTLRLVSSSAVVRSDILLLRRIVQNFLSNAIRYTHRGGILLGCRRVGDRLSIEVWDTGPGIPGDQIHAVFEEFHRLRKDINPGDRGIGLGLAIVKRAAKMLDLPVSVRSVPGRGSVFSITVPRGTSPPSAVRKTRADGALKPLHGALILVLDDQRDVLAGMQALLSGWGCTVCTASSGAEALAALEDMPRPPDVMIADFHLEGGSTGVNEIGRIRQAAGQAIPGVIITADYSPKVQALIKQHDYWLLKKPLNPAQLRSLLSSVLS
ncbi:MAG TPA: NahK/ErcS family hybrid sensor histidine kinase/response regulator [Aliidongia sp.]|nr:NahK/ErcS family hybrid sensor histidine kinase/response regulator [Aliidongia sp.]